MGHPQLPRGLCGTVQKTILRHRSHKPVARAAEGVLRPRPVSRGARVDDLPTKISEPSSLLKKTILVVDDVPEVCELVAAILSDLGYEVVCASDGERALQILAAGLRCDLLFTDIMMPGLHGFELARRSKALRPTLRIIYFTGYAPMLPDDAGETFGPILKKPFRAQELRAVVRTEMGD